MALNLSPSDALRETWATPWKARNEIERLLLMPLAWISLRGSGITIGEGWRFYGLPIWQKHRQSQLTIGARANLRSTVRSNPLGPMHACILSTRTAAAHLQIGDDFGMTGGAIVAEQLVPGLGHTNHQRFVGGNLVV